jgi:hypothetical protein
MTFRGDEPIYFYELHEGEDEVFSDVLLAHEAEYDEDEFLALVLEAREAVLTSFEEDTLIEAVAKELQLRHGFLAITDDQLRVAVNVSVREGETVVAAVHETPVRRTEDDDFRSMLIEVEGEDRPWRES